MLKYDFLPRTVIIRAFKQCIKEIKSFYNVAFIIFSNNKHAPIINSVLDEICPTQTKYRKNPKTRRMIKIWIL